MTFRTMPILRVGALDDEWILEAPMWYVTKAGKDIVVPPHFVTDLASIPRLLHWLFPVNGKHRAAAILHDWLYHMQETTRAEADAMFLEAMEVSGVRWTQRHALYAGVRVGGWVAWGKRN